MTEQQLAWWRSQYSGLETDSCPTIDLPDNGLGGALARVAGQIAEERRAG